MKRRKLIEYRGERTQAEMGRIYGVSQQAWNMWENGINRPDVVAMKKLERDMKVVCSLLGRHVK